MSIKQVADQIKKKYKVGPSAETIFRKVVKGHVGTSPMRMGPVGPVPRCDYRYLCDAFNQSDQQMRRIECSRQNDPKICNNVRYKSESGRKNTMPCHPRHSD
jgi:hypothetical protein